MKKNLTLLLVVITFKIFAQTFPITGINISLPSNPDANTANWGSGTSLLTITATAKAGYGRVDASVEESKILVIIKKGGSKVCGTYTVNSAPGSNFNTLTKVWSGANAVALLGQDCVLVPGDYEMSVQFFGYGPKGMAPISDEKIKSFTIIGAGQQLYQAPQAITPVNFNVFSEENIKKPITFRWTSVFPRPTGTVTYCLKVWQLMQGQTGVQAMNANQPIVNNNYNNIMQVVILNLVPGPLLAPYLNEFIWTVQASKDGKPIGDNNGMSGASAFKSEDTTTNPPATNTSSLGCTTISTKSFTTGDIISLSDDFKMKLTAPPTGTNDSLTGKGTVLVKWLGLLNVKFKGIKINGQDQLCTGAIYTNSDSTQVYPTQWAINSTNNNSWGAWTISKIKSVCADIKAHKILKPMVKATNQIDAALVSIPLNMPLGYFKANDTTTSIGFTEMVFKPDHAEFEVIASLPTKGVFKHANNNGMDEIALRGSGIHFKSSGLSGITGSIKLLDPIVFSFATGSEYLKLKFNNESNGHLGNGVVFSAVNNEFWKYDFDVNVELPKEWLIPVDPAKTNVDMNFQMEIAQWSDFVIQGNLPACIIPHTNGMGIEAGAITYDHSSITNAPGMVFPDGYAGDSSAIFSGFYLKNFKLTLPDQLRSYADTSKTIQVTAENLIIDEYGITGIIHADNVLNYPKGNIGNLGASIDTVKVSLNSSVLTEAMILGKITLPLSSSDDNNNAINYSAIFSSGNPDPLNPQSSSITFALKPGQDITSKFLGDGKVQIDQTSTLNLILSKSSSNKREIKLDIDLNGKLYYPSGKIIDPGSVIPLDLDLSCNFQHLGMSYDKTAQETFTFNPGQWSFASPQKKLSGFAFTITDVKPKIEPIGTGAEKQYLFKGGVEFVAKINIGSENSKICISGDTKIALTGAIESSKYTPSSSTSWPTTTTGTQLSNTTIAQNLTTIGKNQSQLISNSSSTNPNVIISSAKADYGFLTQLKPVYLGVNVESIHVDATMPALTIKGIVDFYKHDAVYGNGFKGDLQAKFTTLDMTIQAGAIFGNTKYVPNHVGPGFKYWMVQAQVKLPPPGIVFMTGVAFRGFGAGVYSRMNMTPPAVFNPTTASSSTFGGAIFTPCDTVSIGFKVKAIIATTPKEETFNGSVALGAEFNTNGGMNFIKIEGLFNCGAKIGNESEAFANGNILVSYDFPHKLFDMTSALIINKNPLSTDPGGIQVKLHIDGLNNKWFFMSGTPSIPNKVKLLGVGINSYMMFGNDIEIPQGFMKETRDGFASIGHSLPSFQDNSTGDNKYQSAKGFAFGLGLNYSNSDSWNIASFHGYWCDCDRYVNANYSIVAGGEIDASLLQYTGCDGFGKGWRAKASIAMYAGASLGYSYSLPVLGTSSGLLGKVDGSAYVTAEFPNPTYFEGQLDGDFSIGGYSVGFHKHFKNGSQCNGAPVGIDPGINQNVYTQQNVSDSLNYSLIKDILTPGSTSGISRSTGFSVLLNYPANEPFDLQEQQSSGQMKVRTFRAIYTVALTQDSTVNNNGALNSIVTNNSSVRNTSTSNSQPITTVPVQKNSSVKAVTTLQRIPVNNGLQSNVGPTQSAILYTPIISYYLSDAGYDAMGAKMYRESTSANPTLINTSVNVLKPNVSYKFEIKGALEEKVNNNWQAVNHKNSTIPITQTKNIYFKTNSAPINTGGTVAGNATFVTN
jgi:hypothetical protein